MRTRTDKIPNFFLLCRFNSLAGVFSLGLFLFYYFYSNAKALGPQGVEVFNNYRKSLSAIPFLPLFEFVFVLAPLVFFVFTGLIFFYRGQGNFWQYPTSANLRYTLHRTTGFLGFIFLAYYFLFIRVGAMVSNSPVDYLSQVHFFEGLDAVIVTLLGGTALFYFFAGHLANTLISWGLTVTPASQARSTRWCFFLFVMMTVLNFIIVINYFYHYETPPAWIAFLLHFVKTYFFAHP